MQWIILAYCNYAHYLIQNQIKIWASVPIDNYLCCHSISGGYSVALTEGEAHRESPHSFFLDIWVAKSCPNRSGIQLSVIQTIATAVVHQACDLQCLPSRVSRCSGAVPPNPEIDVSHLLSRLCQTVGWQSPTAAIRCAWKNSGVTGFQSCWPGGY